MIEPALSAGLAGIAARERDVLGAYQPGFNPEASDVARRPKITPSADPLSVAAPEGTYLVTPDATGKLQFSRDGSLKLAEGELQFGDGRPVLGFALGNRTTLAPLRVDPYDAALGRIARAGIDSDGTFGYTRTSVDPRTGEARSERVICGRLALVRFPAGTQPSRVDAVHVRAPRGVTPHIGTPADGNFGALIPHARDLGRVDILAGLEKLNESYLSYQALRSAHHARGALAKTALDLVK